MIENVKVDKVDGCNVYITVNCSEDSNITHQENDILRLPVRRVKKPPFFNNDCKEPAVFIDGMKWPSFAEYVKKNVIKAA